MTEYNAIVQLGDRYADDLAEQLVDELLDYHPAVGRGPYGHLEAIITVQAESLRQAISTVLAVAHAAGRDVYALEVLPTAEFDRRAGLEPVPELLSVKQVSEALGISRQAVQQRINGGTFPAHQIGKAWAVPRAAVEFELAQRARQAEGAPAKPTVALLWPDGVPEKTEAQRRAADRVRSFRKQP